ncbi:hypothetical protein AMS68_001353 [Peltaster fructicola]|uniref:Something about silencing protein 4 domain-containing protein n=1 Tax=Peltaster fructicola TaxID=286661 RepID=A0A6H0XMA3_9PEZI|nr:hypothetical protein AMS68_001353 [Peltaster fructicola]
MSRSGRALKPPGSRLAAFLNTASQQASDAITSSSHSITIAKPANGRAPDAEYTNDDFPDNRAAKRRKLEIRSRQQTLDNFFSSNPSRPPVKIAASQPNGSVVQTINGVTNELPTSIDNVLTDGAGALDAPPRAVKKLKAAQAQKQEEKRTLRSQDDGPRLKSDLATYFNNYEDIIFDTPKELELLSLDTSIYIDDGPSKHSKGVMPSPAKSVKEPQVAQQPPQQAARVELNIPTLMQAVPDDTEDPLTDDAFQVSHRRAERKEKQMRNIEREHAMHEKVQLERLLDGLLGHDWLRVLGITGVTESEAKKYEPKRDYFVDEVRALVDKFNAWKEEEKRQKYEREAVLAAEREVEDSVSTKASSVEPASSDLNVSASKQLQQETASAMRSLSAARAKRKERSNNAVPHSPVPYRPPSPIVSFYSSRHMRDSALKKSRNSRNVTAFGLPLPEVDDRDFALPSEYVTQDILRASARERRRRNRESAVSKPP